MDTKEHLVFISHSSADKIIANAMCHHLENAGIRCWIAPRDINTTDWAGSIMDGLRRIKVDEEELSDRLRYHLGPCHWLDAVLPPMEEPSS